MLLHRRGPAQAGHYAQVQDRSAYRYHERTELAG